MKENRGTLSLSTQLTNLSFNFAAKSISNVFISNPKFQQVTPSCSHPQSSRPFQYLSKLAKQTGSTLELADVDERMGEFTFAISQSLHPPGVRKSRHLPAGAAAGGRGAGPGRVLHPPLRGHVREGRHEDSQLRDPAPGGKPAHNRLALLSGSREAELLTVLPAHCH